VTLLPAATYSPSITLTPSPSETASPTLAPKPAWQSTLETQDPNDQYFTVVDGQPHITLKNADQTTTSITLTQESIQSIQTTDSRHPNILTGKDADGNIYLINKEHGSWFTFFHGLAPTMEQFPIVDKSDIPVIIDYLRHQPSLLTPDSQAPELSQMLKSTTGQAFFC
jgi:hypothetical protein